MIYTDEEFHHFLQHIKHVTPSMEHRVLLLLDNYSSHLNVETLNLAKENGVVLVFFPPHCTHKLQPLDVLVFGPFKMYCAASKDTKQPGQNPSKRLASSRIMQTVSVRMSFQHHL